MRARLLLWGAATGGKVVRLLAEVAPGGDGWEVIYTFGLNL
jgi:hypothetical protein